MIRKAKRQLHAVREDVVKKQLQVVREEIRQKQHHQAETKSQRQHAGGGTGLKFSDIDVETKTTHWMDEFEDDGDVSHLLSTSQSHHASSNDPLSKKLVQPNLPTSTNNASVFDDLFAEDDHFGESSSLGDPLLASSEAVPAFQPTPLVPSSQQKEISPLFEDGPDLSDVPQSLESYSEPSAHESSKSGEYDDLFSESTLPVPLPKQIDLFKDHSPKQALGFLSSGEYDSLFSDSPLSSSPVPSGETCDGNVITDKVLEPSQDSKQLLGVNGTSDKLPSEREVVGATVSTVTHSSGDETIIEEQREVHSEVSMKGYGDTTGDKESEMPGSVDVQLSEEKVPETDLTSTQSDSKTEIMEMVHQDKEEACGVVVVSQEIAQGPSVASVAVTPENVECSSNPASEEDKSFDNSMEFLSHLDDSSTSASPLPMLQSTEVPMEQEGQPAQKVLEVEYHESNTWGNCEPSDKQPMPHFLSSSLNVAVETTSSTLVALSDASEHPLLSGGDSADTLNNWHLPGSSGSKSSSPTSGPHLSTTALELKEDYYSQSAPIVRKEVATRKTTVEENPSPHSSTSSVSSSQSHSNSLQKLKKSTTGKLVPVVPPRPPCLSASPKLGRKVEVAKRQDSDAVSIASLTSVISNDSVFLKEVPSVTAENELLSSSSGSKTSVKESITNNTECNVTLSSKTSNNTGDSQDASADKVAVTLEKEELGEFDYTLLILTLSILCLYLYYALNPFVYLAGFMSGFLMFYLTVGSAFVLYVQHSEKEMQRRKDASKDFPSLPNLDELPSNANVDLESYRRLEGKQMAIVHRYHPNSHHPSKRIPARVVLYDDFMLDVRYRTTVQTKEGPVTRESKLSFDLCNCSVLIVPEEVAQNRKRRWSKKFPIFVSDSKSSTKVYLFVFTSRDKEEWFRRLRHASAGKTYDELIERMVQFNSYMSKYMPKRGPGNSYKTAPLRPTQAFHSGQKRAGQRQAYSPIQHEMQLQQVLATVSFSAGSTSEKAVRGDSLVSIKSTERRHASTSGQGRDSSLSSQISPSPLSSQLDWINAGMARLVWDVWHEEHWRRWVTSRIQRKLVRIKTPSFMEELTVTDVHMGNAMPTTKGPFRPPELNRRGLWVYLVVEYKGDFTMTINTKLKLNAFDKLYYSSNSSTNGSESPTLGQHSHRSSQRTSKAMQNKPVPAIGNPDEGEDEISSGSDDEGTSIDGHSLEEKIHQEIMDKDAQPESTSNSPPSPQASIAHSLPNKPAPVRVGRKQRLLNSMVSTLQHMAVKSKMIQRAAEKVSKQSLVLTVKVRSLDGYLAVNMAPPPSDTLWFGFVKNPHLSLDAKPRLGNREVTLSYVTDWIEKKLCELVEKKLVFPNMEDLVIPILTSGLQEDINAKILSPS